MINFLIQAKLIWNECIFFMIYFSQIKWNFDQTGKGGVELKHISIEIIKNKAQMLKFLSANNILCIYSSDQIYNKSSWTYFSCHIRYIMKAKMTIILAVAPVTLLNIIGFHSLLLNVTALVLFRIWIAKFRIQKHRTFQICNHIEFNYQKLMHGKKKVF